MFSLHHPSILIGHQAADPRPIWQSPDDTKVDMENIMQ